MKSDELCIAKIENVSGTQCHVELIFNGAMEVVKEEIRIDVAAHIEHHEVTDEESGAIFETSDQVGEAGYKPFIDKLKEQYPKVLIVDGSVFDTMVEMQKAQASALGM